MLKQITLFKRQNTFISVRFLLAALLSVYGLFSNAQITIFSESIGTVGGTTTILSHTGWQNASLVFNSGDIATPCDIRTTNVSSGYAGASGNANAFFTGAAGSYGLGISNINASTFQNLTLQFGYRKESASIHATFAIDYWSGSAWVNVANTSSAMFNEAANASTGWYLSKVISIPAGANISGLKIRFVKSASQSIRIDDIILRGASASPPVVTSNTATATVGTAFNYNIIATNAPTSYASSSLPANGLSINTTSGAITGTPNTTGSYSIALEATNGLGSGAGTLSLTVNPGNQTISGLPATDTKTFGAANYNLAATTNSGLPITYMSSNTNVATILGNSVTIVGAGTTTITASQAGDANWNAAVGATQNLTVNQASQTITFGALPNKLTTDAPFALTATASSGLPVSYISSNTAVATILGNVVTIVADGTTVITASQAGDANYLAASNVDQSQLVIQGGLTSQTITFDAISNAIYGDVPITLTATASSGLPVTYSSTSANISIAGNLVTILAPGTASITASQAGGSGYAPANNVIQSLVIAPKNLIVSGVIAQGKTYDGSTTAILDLSGAVLNTLVGSDIIGVAGTGVFASANAGTGISVIPSLTLTGTNASYYTLTQPTLSADISKANQNLVFGTLAGKFFGNAPYTLSATAGASGNPVVFTSDNNSVISIIGNTATVGNAGTANITAFQAGNTNYNDATVVQVQSVGQAFNNITFAALPGKIIGDAPFSLTATSSSGLPVTFTSSNPAVADVVGNIVTIYSVGDANIIASQAGNANYLAATNVSRVLSVTYPLIAAWDFTGLNNVSTATATLFNSNLVSASSGNLITRGPGAASSTGVNSFRTTGFQNNGISTGNTDYFQTKLTSVAGNSLSLSSITANIAGTASFAVAPGVSSQFAYSIDGTTFTLIGSPTVTVGTPASIPLIDVTSISALQNVAPGTTITIRYYASGQTTTGGWGFNSPALGVNGLAFGGKLCAHTASTTNLAICSSQLPYSWNSQSLTAAGTYTFTTTNAAGCDSVATLNLTVNNCNTILNITAFIEGYVDNTLSLVEMRPVRLNQMVAGATATECDDVTVELYASPYTTGDLPIASTTALLSVTGLATATFSPSVSAGDYYIAIKHRTAITTFSASAITIGSASVSYDFTTAASQAAGSNLVEINSTGTYAIYSGDIAPGNGSADNDDFAAWESDANDFLAGYLATDLNGDGSPENNDFAIWENNANNFVAVVEP